MRRARCDERGAVALVVAFSSTILMLVSAFVVDLGMQRTARGDMQGLADVVALDLARDLDGRTVDQLTPVLQADAAASVARNTSSLGSDTPDLTVQLGTIAADGTFQQIGSGVPTAVRVRAATRVAFGFAAITGVADGDVDRRAVSTASSNACFRLGSFAAALRTGDSALAGVFESMVGDPGALGVNLQGVSYQGALASYLDVGLLAAQLGAATPQALVERGDISVPQLFAAGAKVLTAQGDTAGSAVLGTIAAKASASTIVHLADILSVGDGSAAGSTINVVDLIGSAALSAAERTQIADQNNLLDTGVVWSAPHTSSGDVGLRVIEPPKEGCGSPGSATASTGQVRIATDFGFNLPNKVDGLSVGTIADPTTTQDTVHVDAELAGASGVLTGMTCGDGVEETRVRVDTRLTTATISLPLRVIGDLGLAKVDLQLTVSTSLSTAPRTGTTDTRYDVPPHDYTDPQPSAGASGYLALGTPKVAVDLAHSTATVAGVTVSVSTLPLLDSLLSAITSSVIGTSMAQVTTNINQAMTPLAHLLGIQLAGADVFGVPKPTCAQPRLAG